MRLFLCKQGRFVHVLLFIAWSVVSPLVYSQSNATPVSESALSASDAPDLFMGLLTGESGDIEAVVKTLGEVWQPSMVPMALETIVFTRSKQQVEKLISLLQAKTGESHGSDIDAWYRWLWSEPEQRHPHYADFKSRLYRNIDPLFAAYFADARPTLIRLDEVRWGGVVQDGIPPLRQPEMIDASNADYLADADVVFGVEIEGDARAYPKRILAWHEMFIDKLGSTEFAGVYCTLCGMVVLYETSFDGVRHALGTSGFLYRSNKLMYDQATQSLWSTTRGEPVIGPLVGRSIQLSLSYVVTTTWAEWKRRHPDSRVLSLNTGFERDYGEGVAYQSYFASDKLMFTVPALEGSNRLPNKAEILALRFPSLTKKTAAISAKFLNQRSVFHHRIGPQEIVVLTDPSGANRVYDATGLEIVTYDGDQKAIDSAGEKWTLSESAITNSKGKVHKRLPAHRAFWFGWNAVYPETELVM